MADDVNIHRPTGLKSAAISAVSASSDVTVVAATAGKRCRVYRMIAVADAAATLTVKRGSTALTGAMAFAANSGLVLEPPATWVPWFVTAVNEALVISRGSACALAGEVLYSLEAA